MAVRREGEQQQQLNQYGRPIVKGMVFGYLCVGRGGNARDDKVYRFGWSTRLGQVGDDGWQHRHIERLGLGGLNGPEAVVLWYETRDVHLGWEVLKGYLRNHMYVSTDTSRPEFKHETRFGDNFFSLETATTTQQLQTHLSEAFGKLVPSAAAE